MRLRFVDKIKLKKKLLDDVSEREEVLVGGFRKKSVRYRWDEGGFYSVLKARVKKYFLEKHGHGELDPRKASVNGFVKVGGMVGSGLVAKGCVGF